MSAELKSFLFSKGIATSRSTAYNPRGNGQVERYNGVIWKAVSLALRSRDLRVENWEVVLPDALHSVRTLLSTATNETPHERLFRYQRRSTSGNSIPTWLARPGEVVLMKRHVRQKYDPLVDEVELIEANPQYAHVRLPDGRETTVSIRHLAPRGTVCPPDSGAEVLFDTQDCDPDTESQPMMQHDTLPNDRAIGEECRNTPTEIPEPGHESHLSDSQLDTSVSNPQSRPEPKPTTESRPVPKPKAQSRPKSKPTASEAAPSRERSTRPSRMPPHLVRDYVL